MISENTDLRYDYPTFHFCSFCFFNSSPYFLALTTISSCFQLHSIFLLFISICFGQSFLFSFFGSPFCCFILRVLGFFSCLSGCFPCSLLFSGSNLSYIFRMLSFLLLSTKFCLIFCKYNKLSLIWHTFSSFKICIPFSEIRLFPLWGGLSLSQEPSS